ERALEFKLTFGFRRAVQDYARAFREYGVDVEALPADEAVARLQGRPALAAALAATLDDWVVGRWNLHDPGPSWTPLVVVARGLDPDAQRDRLRAMWFRPVTPESQAELRKLVESIDVKTQSPATLLALAITLRDFQLADSALRIMRDSQFTYP